MSSVTFPIPHSEALPEPRPVGVSSEEYHITGAEEEIPELFSTTDNEYLSLED